MSKAFIVMFCCSLVSAAAGFVAGFVAAMRLGRHAVKDALEKGEIVKVKHG